MTRSARDEILDRVRVAREEAQFATYAHPGAYAAPRAHSTATIASFVEQVRASGAELIEANRPASFDHDVAVFDGVLGVAESGAIWVVPVDAKARQQLFLSEHIAIVVHEQDVVDTLHDAYARLNPVPAPFACFVAGPSKTADIEQTLVIGAHGPLALTVVLITARD